MDKHIIAWSLLLTFVVISVVFRLYRHFTQIKLDPEPHRATDIRFTKQRITPDDQIEYYDSISEEWVLFSQIIQDMPHMVPISDLPMEVYTHSQGSAGNNSSLEQ